MPLIRIEQPIEQSKLRVEKRPSKFYKTKKFWIGIILGLFVIIGSIGVKIHLDNQALLSTASQFQKQSFKGTVKMKSESKAYSVGSDIPNARQLAKYHNSPGNLNHRGYIAVPKQKGVNIPIKSMQINEGSSNTNMQNKAMSYGAVTSKSNQLMGEIGNFGIEAHTFSDGQTFFSPMQRGIDVNKQPKVYLTDGNKIYIYQLNIHKDNGEKDSLDAPKTYDDPSQIPGERIINKMHGSVMDDEVAKDSATLTMSTCYERGSGRFNMNPVNRIVMTGRLVEAKDFSAATDWERSLFTQLAA